MRLRDAVAAAVAALIAGTAVVLPPLEILQGLSIDILTALRWHAFGSQNLSSMSPVVVVAMDEETYRTPPFQGTPSIAWTRELGRVLTAILDGGAKVVGLDIVYPIAIEQSELPFGDETLGARLRGFDRDFLRALALAARDRKIVLGEIQHREQQPILPSLGQRAAVGYQRNIRLLNVYTDADEVVRRIPLTFLVDGAPAPSMAVELAARALGATPQFTSDGSLMLASHRVTGKIPNTMTLNFAADAVPTFSFADIAICAAKGNSEFFRREFSDKVVVIGTSVDGEDRKMTSKRFATAAPHAVQGGRCALPISPQFASVASHLIPGVYVQATAIKNLIYGDALSEPDRNAVLAIAVLFAGLVAIFTLLLGPTGAFITYVGGLFVWSAIATFAFNHAVVLPLIEPAIAGLIAFVGTVGYRFVAVDKDKRLLRRSFALYLSPTVIDKMLASNRPPVLGGETRNVTSFFSDIAGFSTFAENLAPSDLVNLMNEYLSAMTDIIEAHGGFVDRYSGDGIAAVFGAPVDDEEHAANAVHAALQCRRRLAELNATIFALGSLKLGHRIGLNSGAALVGNIGSRRRFNYTVMGDVVNLASRLEGANKYFGISTIASEATVAATRSKFIWRELDTIRVQGRSQTVKIFEPLAVAGEATREQLAYAASYAQGLDRWRSRDFKGAVTCFSHFADADPPSSAFLARAERNLAQPPGPEWAPVYVLEGK